MCISIYFQYCELYGKKKVLSISILGSYTLPQKIISNNILIANKNYIILGFWWGEFVFKIMNSLIKNPKLNCNKRWINNNTINSNHQKYGKTISCSITNSKYVICFALYASINIIMNKEHYSVYNICFIKWFKTIK